MIRDFTDLETWRKSHSLSLKIYSLTRSFPAEEKFGITSQIQRAASSITANIAEGFERYHFKDKTRFYYQARGSAAEVLNFLLLAKDLGYTDHERYLKIGLAIKTVRKLINGLINSVGHK